MASRTTYFLPNSHKSAPLSVGLEFLRIRKHRKWQIEWSSMLGRVWSTLGVSAHLKVCTFEPSNFYICSYILSVAAARAGLEYKGGVRIWLSILLLFSDVCLFIESGWVRRPLFLWNESNQCLTQLQCHRGCGVDPWNHLRANYID